MIQSVRLPAVIDQADQDRILAKLKALGHDTEQADYFYLHRPYLTAKTEVWAILKDGSKVQVE